MKLIYFIFYFFLSLNLNSKNYFNEFYNKYKKTTITSITLLSLYLIYNKYFKDDNYDKMSEISLFKEKRNNNNIEKIEENNNNNNNYQEQKLLNFSDLTLEIGKDINLGYGNHCFLTCLATMKFFFEKKNVKDKTFKEYEFNEFIQNFKKYPLIKKLIEVKKDVSLLSIRFFDFFNLHEQRFEEENLEREFYKCKRANILEQIIYDKKYKENGFINNFSKKNKDHLLNNKNQDEECFFGLKRIGSDTMPEILNIKNPNYIFGYTIKEDNGSEIRDYVLNKSKEVPILCGSPGHFFVLYNEKVYESPNLNINIQNKEFYFFILNENQIDEILNQKEYYHIDHIKKKLEKETEKNKPTLEEIINFQDNQIDQIK